jgi:type I restriction enzyme, S subunit
MELKPGYKQTEVGVIPVEWDDVKIGEVTNIYIGRDLLADRFSRIFDSIYRFPVYSNTVAEQGLYGFYSVPEYEGDSLTVVGRGVGLGTAFARTGGYGAIGRLLVLFPNGRAEARFLATYINQRVSIFIETGGIPQLTGIQFSKYKVALPPLPEQQAIAEVLSDVDALLDGLDRLIAKKRDLKQAAMQQLLTGQTRLPGFEGEWEVKTLGEMFDFSGGYSASRDQLSAEGHCYLHYGDIHGASKTWVDTLSDYQDIPKLNIPLKQVSVNSLLKDGDVVFVDASEDDEGTSKHVVVVNKDNVPFISGLHTIVAKSKTDELAHEYRRYCFQTPSIRQQFLFYAVGTKVSGISKTNIAKLTIPVPAVPEQTAIAAILSDMDAELAALEQHRGKTRALKQAMMQELLTGKTRLVSPRGSHA